LLEVFCRGQVRLSLRSSFWLSLLILLASIIASKRQLSPDRRDYFFNMGRTRCGAVPGTVSGRQKNARRH
jgi:hypothetical protein